jgi:hypothetical protein
MGYIMVYLQSMSMSSIVLYLYIYYYHSLYMGYIGISQLYKQNLGLRTSSARKTGRMPGLRGEVGGKV